MTFMYIGSNIEDDNFIFFQGTTTMLFYKDFQDEKNTYLRPIDQ